MFLTPLFLVGFAAVAIPILIHLTHRERREAVSFPSLMFLRRVPFRTVKRQRIRHWPLFILRAAAIVLAVAAFSRPLVKGGAFAGANPGTAREVVILLDRSYSMEYGERWSRAIGAAQSEVDGLRPEDRATIVLFSDHVEVANQPTADRVLLAGLLRDARLSSGRTRYEPALQVARDVLEASRLPRREVVLITDFQRTGWASQSALRMPDGTTVRAVDLSDPDPANAAVAGVLLERTGDGGGRVHATARLVNNGAAALTHIPVRLEIADDVVETRSLDVGAGSSAIVRFAGVPVPNYLTRGRIVVESDALPGDDVFRFVLYPESPLRVLVVHHPRATGDELLYLQQALGIGRSPPVAAEFKAANRVAPEDFAGVDAVIVDDAAVPRGASARRLLRFVSDGGGLGIVLGPRSTAGALEFGGTIGPVVDRLADRGAALSILDYDHRVFARFSQPGSGDFSGVRFFRYRRYDGSARAVALARFDDGSLALAEESFGNGSILVLASGIANLWNDLPVRPVFLPFVHQVVRHLADYRSRPAWRSVGEVLDVPAIEELAWETEQVVIESPSGERAVESLAAEPRVELREAGFYEIRPLGGDRGRLHVVAVNADRAESDLTSLDAEEMLAAIAPVDDGGDRARELAAPLSPAERERRQGLWWYLLLAVLLTLMVESGAAHHLSGSKVKPIGDRSRQ